MNSWTRRNRSVALLLCGCCMLSAGCGRIDDGYDASPENDVVFSADTMMVDTMPMGFELTEDTIAGHGLPDEPSDTASLPRIIERESAVRTERSASEDTVRVVHGTAEIDLGRGRYARAAHVRAVLQRGRFRQETLVGRDGEFYFEAVPAGRYRLQILPLRGNQVVITEDVVIAPGDVVTIPHIRIPSDAIAALPRAPM
jgi:hypothetical protein